MKDLKHQHNISLIDQQKRHSVHLRQLEEKHNIEKAAWQHNMMMQLREKLHQEFVIKETHLKNQMEKEKEAEINMVLNKLADENAEEQRRIRIRYNERVVQVSALCSRRFPPAVD